MKLKELAIAATATITSLAGMAPAMAQTYNGAAIYKDALSNVYLAPGSASTSFLMELTGIDIKKTANSDRCGVYTLRFPTGVTPPASITVNGTATSLSSAAETLRKGWTCNQTTGANVASISGATIPSSSNPILKIGNTYYFNGSPLTTYSLGYTGSVTKSVKTNLCGFATLRYSAALKFSSTSTVGGQSGTPAPVALSAMELAPGAPVCRSGSLLLPSGWTP